ncbi:MAG: hypothetical protein HOV83_31090 [Catenulispora sp.]|nr:hypothetical protein [Catenulispora sp.]
MLTHHELALLVSLAIPVLLGLLARLLRRPRNTLRCLAGDLRDLISLRMVLRDTSPSQRADLIRAHRAWREADRHRQT